MAAKYPLEALGSLREAAVSSESRELAATLALARAASEKLTRVEQELESTRAAERERRDDARKRLESGLERAADLEAAARESALHQRALEQLERQRLACRDELARAREREARVRAALSRAESERRALERHREAWQKAEALGREAVREEEALERWSAERNKSCTQ